MATNKTVFFLIGILLIVLGISMLAPYSGILLTMYDTRLRLANQVVDEVRTHFQDLVMKTIIHRNTRLGEAPSFGESIIMHDASSKGSINYLNLAREILQRNQMTQMTDEEKIIPVSN